MDRKDKSDELVEYTPEMQAALEMDAEKKLFVLMQEQGSHRHLAGYRLRPSKRTSESGVKDYRISQYYDIVSTPLLDILKKFPKVAGQIMYNLMSVNYVPKTMKSSAQLFQDQPAEQTRRITTEALRFTDYGITSVSIAQSVEFNFELFDTKHIKAWHNENQEKYKLNPLALKDRTELNPLYWIRHQNHDFLLKHVYVKEFVFFKLRQYYCYFMLLFNLVFQLGTVIALTGFSFTCQLPVHLKNSSNEVLPIYDHDVVCVTTDCGRWRIAATVLLCIRFSTEFFRAQVRRSYNFVIDDSLTNQFMIKPIFLVIFSLCFMWGGNWYCGIIVIIYAWITLPTFLTRFHNGQTIVIFKHVMFTVINHFLMLFFSCVQSDVPWFWVSSNSPMLARS